MILTLEPRSGGRNKPYGGDSTTVVLPMPRTMGRSPWMGKVPKAHATHGEDDINIGTTPR